MLRLLPALLLAPALQAGTLPNLIVDQFGWRTGSAKVAVLAQPQSGQGSPSSFTPGANFDIRRVSDNGLAYSGTVSTWNGGATHAQSGDRGWWADFSALATPGSYYLSLPGGSNPGAQSYPFDLREDAFSAALNASVKSYYYQRCGTAITAPYGGAWTHATCHNATQSAAHLYNNGDQGAGTARDVRGGWHDAGDYRKYVTFTYSVLWDLMTAFEWNACAFGDASGIPESGNGVPDILDEVKWELDWLLKMQIGSGPQAGALYSGVFVTTGGGGTGDPSTEAVTYYYANYSSSATSTGAMAFAKAARLFQSYGAAYPGYAAQLQAAAEAAWAWLQANPSNVPYNHTGFQNANANRANDEDFRMRLGVAASLFRLTGLAAYRTYFDNNLTNTAGAANGGTYHPINNNEFWPEAASELQMACLDYAQSAGATPARVTAIRSALKAGADNRVIWDQNNNTDLYRGYLWDGYYGWGSNQRKSHWGALAVWAVRLGVGTPAEQAAYWRAGEEYLHYLHGRNPLNWCYLSNMGTEGANAGAEQSVDEIYHGWFFDGTTYDGTAGARIGPAPGILAGGANQFYQSDTTASGGTAVFPPAGQPILKSYRNWNTNWPDASWSVTENGIYYQAAYTFLVSSYVPCAPPPGTPTFTATATNFSGSPTNSPTASPTATPTPSPTPVCLTLLNSCETINANGNWTGANAVRSIVAAGGAPAGAVTQGGSALYVNVTATAAWNDQMFNLDSFSPAVWTPYTQLQVDLHVAAAFVTGSTYRELLLRADCASCGGGLWYQPISNDLPSLVAGPQTITFNLDFSAGTIPAGSALSRLTFIYNGNATTPAGAIYVDNVRLVGACLPTPTPTSTRSPSPTASRSATPSSTSSPTSTPSPSATPSSSSTRTPTPTITASPTPSGSPTPSPTATSTWSPTPSSSPTGTRTASASGTPTNSSTPTSTASPSISPTPSSTSTITPGASPTYTLSSTNSPSPTSTPTPSASPSATASGTPTSSPSPTFTASASGTGTPAATGTNTPSPSASSTATVTASATATQTPSASPTSTASQTVSPSASPSPTWTVTPSASATITPGSSPTSTASSTAGPSPSSTPTPSASPSASSSATVSPSATPSATITPSQTSTPTATFTPGPSFTFTPSASVSPSPSPTSSATPSPAAATATPASNDNRGLIDAKLDANPNPGSVWVKLGQGADGLRLEVYSAAFVKVRRLEVPLSGAGSARLSLASCLSGLSSGYYTLKVQAFKQGSPTEKALLLKLQLSR